MVAVTYGADVIGANFGHLPVDLLYAGYTTGSGGVAWSPAQFAVHPDAIRICQSVNASDTTADVLDVENGAATLADCAAWVVAAKTNLAKGARPGQRSPAIYCSQSNITPVVNALIKGGVTSGVGLWVANWSVTQGSAVALLAKSGGPFPVVGYQYENAGLYDLNVWLTSWVNGENMDAQAPPGQWNDPAAWQWKDAMIIGTGLDGNLHVFTFTDGGWVKSE